VEILVRGESKKFSMAWIRDAVNEAIRQNNRNLRAVMDIIDKWSVEGHTSSSETKIAGFSRVRRIDLH
jgi:hypothetical protein